MEPKPPPHRLRLRLERHLGYFPQVFSHLALINACVHLIREDERIAAGQVTQTDRHPQSARSDRRH